MLTYSNVEAASICFSETFEALAEGIEKALWQMGGVPQQHRTDHLSAAVRHLRQPEREEWTIRYQARMPHYGMQPTWNNVGVARENGDVEQSHHRFKEAIDQALRVRSSRDFATCAAYEHFLQNLIQKRNQTRAAPFSAEKAALRPLPASSLAPCKVLQVVISRFSTITVASNVYSVPSRLIGTTVLVRVRSERLEGYVGPTRVRGRCLARPGNISIGLAIIMSSARWYTSREPLPLTAIETTCSRQPPFARRMIASLLPEWSEQIGSMFAFCSLSATTSEAEVETALQIVLEAGNVPSFLTVRDLIQIPSVRAVPILSIPDLDLASYDQLIPSSRRACV